MDHHSRFIRSGELEDLELAIRAGVNSVALIPLNHFSRLKLLNNLGNQFQSRYLRLGDLGDLGKSVAASEEAVAATSPMDPARAVRLSNLSNQYQGSFDCAGDLKDLERAIATKRATPGSPAIKWASLQNAEKEVEDIMSAVQERSTPHMTRLNSPSPTEVLQELPGIHFACHGVSDYRSPSNSHLLLSGQTQAEKLTVGNILNLSLKDAQMAYLSACSTAHNPSGILEDESLHIASEFLLAGFSHVLATLWQSNDVSCRCVAVDFYRELFNVPGTIQGHETVIRVFHHAVIKLRQGLLRQLITGHHSFIHSGA